MICVSIQERSFERCMEMMRALALKGAERIAELRADLCQFTPEQVSLLVAANPHTIVTSRVENSGEALSYRHLCAALESGAEYIDTEVEYPDELQNLLRSKVVESGAKLIVSWHNFTTTPTLNHLQEVYSECVAKGADVVKIVPTANNFLQACRLMRFYRIAESLPHNGSNRPQLVAFAMGQAGKFTRYLALKMGSPLSYTYPDGATATAPGQYSESELAAISEPGSILLPSLMRSAENGDAGAVEKSGSLCIPCSKSHAQRAIVAAIYAKGRSVLENFQPCNDSAAALEVARHLGCRVTLSGMQLEIESPGAEAIKSTLGERVRLHPGESGLLTRLLIPMACYFAEGSHRTIEITAEGSLLTRDITTAADAAESAGFNCSTTAHNGSAGRYMPCTISSGGNTESGLPAEICIDGSSSSQIVSGFIMALPLFRRGVTLKATHPASIPYIELTEAVLGEFGIDMEWTPFNMGFQWAFSGKEEYKASRISLHSDWSSASYFLVAEVIRQSLKIGSKEGGAISFPNLKIGSKQADEAILPILESCGCRIDRKEMRLWAPERLHAFRADAKNSPDLFPILAVLACFCNGRSRINGVSRLAAKESNRAESIFAELSAIGADIYIQSDAMYISGGLHGGNIRSYNDHRIAMSAAVAALFIEEPLHIDEVKCTEKSFPTFFEVLKEYIGMI